MLLISVSLTQGHNVSVSYSYDVQFVCEERGGCVYGVLRLP